MNGARASTLTARIRTRPIRHRNTAKGSSQRLAVFLCLMGLVLILAVSVEALAPFIYAIF